MSIGFTEVVLILLFVLLIFGSKRIPELARALGRASYEFKHAKEVLRAEGRELIEAAEEVAKVEDQPKLVHSDDPPKLAHTEEQSASAQLEDKVSTPKAS